MSLDAARAVADTVLYEGYLLYPYRASAAKNRSRWQFGVLGPPSAEPAAFGEPPDMAMQCLLTPGAAGTVTIHLRFLHLQVRDVQRLDPDGAYVPVDALEVAGTTVLTWDEAVPCEITLPARPLTPGTTSTRVEVPGGTDEEPLRAREAAGPVAPDGTLVGRIVRRRRDLAARVDTAVEPDGDLVRLTVAVTNDHPGPAATKADAVARSLLGAHLLIEAVDAAFVSLLDPPAPAAAAAARCRQHRCWPVLAGPPGSTTLLLGAPIILYDHPQVAEESRGALFDATEIDEILTLRVMTMTDAEKAEARATDPRAGAIVDRCDTMSAADLQRLHGARRPVDRTTVADPAAVPAARTTVADPAARADRSATAAASAASAASAATAATADAEADPSWTDPNQPWWDPAVDAAADPGSDVVLVAGVPVARDSLVRLRPSRRADAQDLFLAGRVARVTAVLSDVDGGSHVAVVLLDDPAADLHDWYGRYYYFAPDELEPLAATAPHRGEKAS